MLPRFYEREGCALLSSSARQIQARGDVPTAHLPCRVLPCCVEPDQQYAAELCCADANTYKLECRAIGVCLNGSLKDTSLSDFAEQMNVNFFGAVAMTKGEHESVFPIVYALVASCGSMQRDFLLQRSAKDAPEAQCEASVLTLQVFRMRFWQQPEEARVSQSL